MSCRNSRAKLEAIQATEEVLKRYGLPDRGIAFRRIVNHCNLTRKPDQVLAAIHYLRSIEGAPDSPPRVVMSPLHGCWNRTSGESVPLPQSAS